MLQPSTLQYLKDLDANNNKQWFDENRNRYVEAKANFEQLITKVLEEFGKSDPEIAWLKAKDCTFRINRDIRFTKDKTPYKNHMGASLNKAGKQSHFADYYFHCEPGGKSLIGGGLWLPDAIHLKKVRQEIDYCWEEFQQIITSKPFVAAFGDLEKKAYSLRREPKGYDKDNPAIEYLKMKSVMAFKMLSDEDLTSKNLVKIVVSAFKALQPLVSFINRSLED
jgi:uncharacterized protein (TIGR02453 family)